MSNQQLAFEKLDKLKVGALFMETGTGKTKVALDLITSKINKVDYVLWICPYSLKNEIESEKQKWAPQLQLDIVGCESIGSSDNIYFNLLDKVENNKTFIVVDESLKIKNKEAKRTQRILKLGSKSVYRFILNGTPVSKNCLDLYTQMNFLSPKILDMSYDQFKDTYTEYYVNGRMKGLVKKQHNIEHLISKIKPYIFESKLDIESRKRYIDYSYGLEDCIRYQEIKEKYLSNYAESNEFDFFSMMTELQQCYTKSDEKEDLINDICDDKQTIIFVKYLSNIPDGAFSVTGSDNLATRKEKLKKFENKEEQILYMTYGVGSFGLNLQFCNRIIFADHTFDYSQKLQSEARIYRIGQNYDVEYYNLWCNCGADKIIKKSLTKKTNLLGSIKKEIEKQGVEEWLKSM